MIWKNGILKFKNRRIHFFIDDCHVFLLWSFYNFYIGIGKRKNEYDEVSWKMTSQALDTKIILKENLILQYYFQVYLKFRREESYKPSCNFSFSLIGLSLLIWGQFKEIIRETIFIKRSSFYILKLSRHVYRTFLDFFPDTVHSERFSRLPSKTGKKS